MLAELDLIFCIVPTLVCSAEKLLVYRIQKCYQKGKVLHQNFVINLSDSDRFWK